MKQTRNLKTSCISSVKGAMRWDIMQTNACRRRNNKMPLPMQCGKKNKRQTCSILCSGTTRSKRLQ